MKSLSWKAGSLGLTISNYACNGSYLTSTRWQGLSNDPAIESFEKAKAEGRYTLVLLNNREI